MKTTFRNYILIMLLLVVAAPTMAFAQKHDPISKRHFFADIGTPPGFSLTYGKVFSRHFGMGFGCQGYWFHPTEYSSVQFVPAAYGDLRFYIHPREKGFFFFFMDLGIDFYQHINYTTGNFTFHTSRNIGIANSIGFGHCWNITKLKGGIYVSLKTVGNFTTPKEYDITTQKESQYLADDGTIALSIGYRF